MSNRYTVAPGQEFNYPDAASLKIIEKAGGRSKLSEEDKLRVKYKVVKAGDDCDDMPASALALYLERGWVIDAKAVAAEDAAVEKIAAEGIAAEKEDVNG